MQESEPDSKSSTKKTNKDQARAVRRSLPSWNFAYVSLTFFQSTTLKNRLTYSSFPHTPNPALIQLCSNIDRHKSGKTRVPAFMTFIRLASGSVVNSASVRRIEEYSAPDLGDVLKERAGVCGSMV